VSALTYLLITWFNKPAFWWSLLSLTLVLTFLLMFVGSQLARIDKKYYLLTLFFSTFNWIIFGVLVTIASIVFNTQWLGPL